MSKSNILELVEALREAGQTTPNWLYQSRREIAGDRPKPMAKAHNTQVDAAAKALVAEIEKQPCEKFSLKNPQEILHIPEVP